MLDHDNGWMQSKENTDIYCTREPQLAFHQRIQFCLDLHNHSVKAMRFPPKSYHQVSQFDFKFGIGAFSRYHEDRKFLTLLAKFKVSK